MRKAFKEIVEINFISDCDDVSASQPTYATRKYMELLMDEILILLDSNKYHKDDSNNCSVSLDEVCSYFNF